MRALRRQNHTLTGQVPAVVRPPWESPAGLGLGARGGEGASSRASQREFKGKWASIRRGPSVRPRNEMEASGAGGWKVTCPVGADLVSAARPAMGRRKGRECAGQGKGEGALPARDGGSRSG
jgi:hypothetical protein